MDNKIKPENRQNIDLFQSTKEYPLVSKRCLVESKRRN